MPSPEVKKIGKYEIHAELGQGGFGRVYRAFDPTVGRPVALKILMTEGNQDLLTRFKNEATSAGNLRHRNIVTIYDFGEYSGRPYLVMELLEGEDLTQTISSAKPLTLLQKMNVMDQVADGLDCAHSNGVVHRDVKPANIRLLPDGTVKILDFGIARVSRDQRTRLTQQGDLIGTILYVSPEQFGGADADALCDIFAYGVTYYEFLTGKHPFGSSDPRSVMFKITMEDPPSLRSLLPECPDSLEQVLNRALHKDRELRYQSLRDLRLDTEPLIIELKQDRARQLVAEARELSAHETQPEALALINEALNLDPGNKEARQLRESVQRQLQKKALQPRVDGMLQTAKEQLAKGSVFQAVQTLESANKLDQTDVRIHELLGGAREKLKIVKDAARLATLALAHANRAEWPAALEKASEAAQLDSSNRDAARALDAVQKYEVELTAKIETELNSGDLTAAISGLNHLATLRPGSVEIQNRLAEITANKAERDRIQVVLEQAQSLVAAGQFAQAIDLLAGLPDEPHIAALRKQAETSLSARKRSDSIAKAVESAGTLLRASHIDEALQQVDCSLLQYPGEEKLVALRQAALQAKSARDRAAALRQAIEEGRRLLENPKEAVEFLRNATVQYPEDGAVKQLMAEAEESLRSQQRREAVNQAKEEAERRLSKNDFEGALAVLTSSLQSLPKEPALLELRRKALDAQASQERRRLVVAQAAQECERLIQSANFPEALRVVQEVLKEYADDPLLLEKQLRAQAEQERHTNAVRGALMRSGELEKKNDFAAALAEIDAALARYPGEKSLAEKRAALATAQSTFVQQLAQKAARERARDLTQRSHSDLRDQEIDGLLQDAKDLAQAHSADREIYRAAVDAGQHLLDLRQARAKAAAGDLATARAVSADYLKRFPQHAGFLALETKIAERERQIAIEYKKEVEEVLRESADVDHRVRTLDEAKNRYPGEPFYRKELDSLNSARAAAEKASSLEKAGQFKEAADLWKGLSSAYPSYPGLPAHLDRASGLHQHAQLDARNRWLEQIQKAVNDGSYAEALELIAKAQAAFPGEFNQLATEAKQGADRRAQAQRLLSEAKESTRKAQWSAAQEKLRAALESIPGDYTIAKQAIDAHAKYARTALTAGDWRAADALLDQASTLNPGFKAPAELRSAIEERKQVEYIENALNESRRLETSGQVQPALDAIQAALQIYPADSRLRERKSALENILRESARQEERKRVLEELHRLETEATKMVGLDQLERILQRAQIIAKAYPNDGGFASPVDSILNQVEPLRRGLKLLAENKFEDSEKTANEALKRFSDHPAFAALKRSIKDARDRAAANYRAEIAQKLAAARNPGGREAILTEALARYPSEPSFKQELDSLRQKQQQTAGLIKEALKEARDAEQATRYDEAIRQWEKLRALDEGNPQPDTQIQRLRTLLASVRAAAIEAALTEVRAAIGQGSLPQADALLRRVETEFGAIDQAAALRARLDALIESKRLADEGRSLLVKGDLVAGAGKLVQAARKMPNEPAVAQGIFAELIRTAETVLTSDWRAADSVLQAATGLQPDSERLPALRTRIEEKRREELIAGALKESQQQHSHGDLRGAEKSIQKALTLYPAETRLTEQLTAIRSALAEQTRLERRNQAIAELTAIAKEAETANLKRLRKAIPQIDAVLARTASDPEVQAKAKEVITVLTARISELEAPTPRQQVPPPPAPQQAPQTRQLTVAPAAVAAPPKRNLMVMGATAAVVVIVGVIAILRWTSSDHQTPVNVTSDLAGASVTVGSQSCQTPTCTMKLAPGTYTLTAKKDGYKTITQPVTIAPRQAELNLPLAFESLPQLLQVNTNFENGRVLLDGNPAGNLRDGQFSMTAGLPPGQHTLRVTGGGADFQTTWKSAVGTRPELVGQMEAKDVVATVIANAGSSAAIACNCGVQNITVDGAPAGQTQATDAASAPLQNLAEGSRKLSIADHSLILNVRPNPTLNVFLSLDRNVGTIVVETSEDNARVFLNNKLYRRTTQGGMLRIPVDVGDYSVRVEKDGFQRSPAQTVAVKKGDEARFVTALTPIPPVMEIAGAVPGAQVKLDGRAIGEVGANGALRTEVQAGEHVIEITKDDYTPAKFTATFTPGKTVRLDQAQLPMAKVVRAPAAPDPKQIDAQDWDRVRASNNIDSLEDYVRKHPDGAHVDEARGIVTRLRQDAQAAAARQADQSAWDATDKNSKSSLQGYLSRYASGAHAQEARGLISGIDGKESEALAAAQRAKESKDKELEQANRVAADQQSIGRFFATYAEAYSRMDLKTVEGMWNPMPRNVADITSRQFRDAKTLSLQMTPVGQAAINGDTAVVTCTRTLSMVTRSNDRLPAITERVRVTLKRAGPGWVISSIEVI